ncbi:selenocysteine-specific translation elongation factor [[Clostridium] scindens]|uniref:Selenocysteine-specific elongation factor n=2 Tax=Clostridium scindens (strain JCM 10418 / VPI 12708) TaxID=29347 RepID=B0NFK0_CLOS5|nr:selenocysteine-specific translation elongation factor [[Clostridium] scindens]EGN32579.1 selenocysteine-specific translation elongation factor [Lachnospiraceae bacterium 5_1_57FAA]MBS5695184.1 selenocysteine-specific translation elongation factor [Lachnospiraceae bacterium]EDS06630.1 selenocysteine-specific translation elongation factor [[Clostridium] scindens ATCC 35704]MBO1681166.1 selenocysteine-specific translation elongation factor [[Clostridium] scindens]MCI6395265.1 selenocysteine-sp
MKNIIIGTAGHIDHGKTTLIKALTGRNTDRWEEEQRRGITIDLGFTYFDLPSGDRAGIIDVPGHERFINNMVAGVVGMDMVLLVIAADEGIMPQTREHMDILNLLGIEKSIIVLNKCDLVDGEWMELVEEEVKEELEGTFLEHAPVVKVSAATGEGLEVLIDTISQMTSDEMMTKDISTIPRLPIDRAFTLSGFGTIITGTLVSGTITKDDLLEMYPIGKECKIRSIQVHGQDRKECYAGQRVAINLSNVKKREIKRGCVLAPPNSMKNTDLLDVRLNVLESSMRVLTNHTRLHFFTGTSEILCRAVLLDKEEIGPGESGYVQLRLEEEIAVRRGDKFVVRFYSPMETIGGGVILEPNPGVKKRFQENVIEELKRKESGSSADVIELHVRERADTLITTAELAKLTALSIDEVQEDISELLSQGLVQVFAMRKDTYVWHAESIRAAKQTLDKALREYEEKYPYRYGMKKAEVQMTYFQKIKPNVFDKIVEMLIEEGCLKRVDEFLCTPQYQVKKDTRYDKVSGILLDTFTNAKYDFVRYSEIDFKGTVKETADDILNILLEEQKIVKVTEDMYTLTEYMERAKELIQEHLKGEPVITIAQVRDMFDTSRKSAKPIIEYMDSIKVTKKTGAESERVAY